MEELARAQHAWDESKCVDQTIVKNSPCYTLALELYKAAAGLKGLNERLDIDKQMLLKLLHPF